MTVTILSEGYDGAGGYWTPECLKKVAGRFLVWQQEFPDRGFPVRMNDFDGPPVGHISELYYDAVSRSLKGAVDTTSDTTGHGDDALACGAIHVRYKVAEADAMSCGSRRILDATLARIAVFVQPQGMRLQPE